MTKPSERAAQRRKRAGTAAPAAQTHEDRPPTQNASGPLAAALSTTRRYPHRISLDITDAAYERLRRLNYELNEPKGAILRKLFDAVSDEEIAERLNGNGPAGP